ncbi:MAG: DsbA family oxidoreductase [Actinomycetota bacterium]|nr:DsbA family oxidoreductase [Actinomycetota bacterium]MDP2287704.1 DsbA family oxidoreductase [Actinomycetota bacterium]
MQIEVWSDLVCPWCFIGKRQLEIALSSFEHKQDVTIWHRAYQLNPQASTTTQATTEMLAAKYGVSVAEAKEMQRGVSDAAASVGLNYQLDRTLSGNTRDGHRLVLWAQDLSHASGERLLNTLFSAYFEQGASIFGIDELTAFAAGAGLDEDAARDLLTGEEYSDAVHRDQEIARALGCTGVPFFVLDERFGVTGAQSSELFASALAQAWEAGSGTT